MELTASWRNMLTRTADDDDDDDRCVRDEGGFTLHCTMVACLLVAFHWVTVRVRVRVSGYLNLTSMSTILSKKR